MAAPGLPPSLTFRRPAVLLATWFGTGLLPKAPGTWASLSVLPLAWALHVGLGGLGVALGAAALVLVGWWAADRVVRQTVAAGGSGDPAPVVIDEVAGQLVALAPAPLDPFAFAVGFIAFRAADIMKPWPVSWADRKVKGALGVMLDDVFAGLYAAAVVFAATAGLSLG